jgi:hypothetical protein
MKIEFVLEFAYTYKHCLSLSHRLPLTVCLSHTISASDCLSDTHKHIRRHMRESPHRLLSLHFFSSSGRFGSKSQPTQEGLLDGAPRSTKLNENANYSRSDSIVVDFYLCDKGAKYDSKEISLLLLLKPLLIEEKLQLTLAFRSI